MSISDGHGRLHGGTKTFDGVFAAGNGDDGIRISGVGDIIFDRVFACGNAKELSIADIRVSTGTITMANDVTVGTSDGNVGLLSGAAACPVYEPESMCIEV